MYRPRLQRSLLSCCLLALSSFAIAQQSGPRLLSPPIIGAQTTTSVKVWTMVADAEAIELHYLDQVLTYQCEGKNCWRSRIPVTFEVKGIGMDSVQAQFFLDGSASGSPFWLKTADADLKSEWSFLVGSCALYGVGLSGMVKPGRYTEIFDEMAAIDTDFMVWLGDNVYLLNGEYNDTERMYEKYTKVRLEPHTNAFLASRPQYAILDDHDFGPDNAEGDFENKAGTLACFKDFWPNPGFGEGDETGSYYKFDYQDASFFMLDDRWYRDSKNNAQMLGDKQMSWLEKELLSSKATFKFIGNGSQVLSTANRHETWAKYDERQKLLDFIRDNRIEGVIFLTGDRHFTELCRLEQPGMYPLYDFTSSPMSSILRKRVNRPNDPEFNHSLRVEGTKVVAHNFGKVTVQGVEGERVCVLETYDDYGKLLWRHEIPQGLLGWK